LIEGIDLILGYIFLRGNPYNLILRFYFSIMPGLVLVYTTVSSKREAEKLGELMVSKRFAACVNIFPITSMYWWKGKLNKDKEFALLFKTTKNSASKLEKEIKKIHPYEVPCIVASQAKASKEFFGWLNEIVKNGS
jgi:periplasmic divalent cation tolerance protein